MIYFCLFTTLGLLESASAQQPYPDDTHLEPIIQHYSQYPSWRFVLPTMRSLLIEYSDLIRNLQQRETHDDFLPYIAEYEAAKSSPINPHIRIFFYDRSKLPVDHEDRIRSGVSFPGFNFIFIEENAWFNPLPSEIDSMFSLLDDYSNGVINQLPDAFRELWLDYKSMSDEEEKARFRERYVRSVAERFSDEYRSALRDINKYITLFHQLGHCDLSLGHEERNLAIMNANTNVVLRAIIDDPNLNNILLNELFSNRGITILEDNALLPEDIIRPSTLIQIASNFLSVLDDIQILANASVPSTRQEAL